MVGLIMCDRPFFHKMASRLAPVTGGEKLIFGVFEVERPTISCMTNLGWRQILFSSNNIKQSAGILEPGIKKFILSSMSGDNSLTLPLML
uniref:Uncharacterized protein n=1 Tax=Lactuca sativa TaxID=4236 RepID=A0A9R1V1C0_LACSA|nr:hypothetical protein LSAT_V11C700383080 [Lactuca sativa]